MRFITTLLAICLFLSHVRGQETATVCGKVTTSGGQPLPLANISLRGLPQGTTSDTTGYFCLNVPAGRDITLVVSSVGFTTLEYPIRLAPGETRAIHPEMKESTRELEEVTIAAEIRRTGSFVPVSIKDYRLIPNASGQFETLLKTLPGVSSRDELSSRYSVRGGNFDENLVYVNGVEIYRPFLIRSGQQEGLSFINPDLVGSVKFSAGGFGAVYGDRMSSVLDITYRTTQKTGGSASLSFLGGSVHLEGLAAKKKISWLAGIRYKTNRYLLQSLDIAGDYQPSFFDFQTYLQYTPAPRWKFSFLGNLSLNEYRFVPEDRETSFGTVNHAVKLYVLYDGQEQDRFNTWTGALTAAYKPSSSLVLKFTASAFRTMEAETFDILGRYSLNELDKEMGSESLGDSILNIGIGSFLNHARNYLTGTIASMEHRGEYLAGGSTWSWGLKYRYETVDHGIHEWKMVDSAGFSVPYNNETVNLSCVSLGELTLRSGRLTSFLQYSRRFMAGSGYLSLNAGMRSNYWDLTGEWLLSPRISIVFEPNWEKDYRFHLSGGTYHQPPLFREYTDREGNSNLHIKAQRSVHFVGGADRYLKLWERPFVFSAEAYFKWMDRLIPYRIENMLIRYAGENLARGFATGLDLKLNGEFVPGTESWASLSLMRTREDIPGDSYTDETGAAVFPGYYPRPTDQLVNFGLHFQDYLPDNPSLRVQLTLMYGSRLPVSYPGTDRYDLYFRMPPYRRVDIGFIKVWVEEGTENRFQGKLRGIRHFSVSAEVFNLLDINNTISYHWISTVNNLSGETRMYAVPNYLTSRRINIKLTVRF